MFDTQIRDAVRQMVGPWWAFLVAGIAWFVISFVVLQMSLTSVRAVGVLLGVIFLYRRSKSSWPHPWLVVGVGRLLLGILFSSLPYGPSSTPSVRSCPLLTCSGCS